jgi:hypothetical protein
MEGSRWQVPREKLKAHYIVVRALQACSTFERRHRRRHAGRRHARTVARELN